MATVYGSVSGNYVNTWFDWTETVKQAENKSTITVRLYAQRTTYYPGGTYGTGSAYIWIDGVQSAALSITPSMEINSGSARLLGTYTRDVTHNSDGSKNCSIYAQWSIDAPRSAPKFGGTYPLTKIARGTTVKSFSASSTALGSVTCAWASAESISALQYSLNDGAWISATGSGTSGTFTISNLTPSTSYRIKIRIQRNSVWATSSTITATTKALATIKLSTSTFNIGADIDYTITNPSGSTLKIDVFRKTEDNSWVTDSAVLTVDNISGTTKTGTLSLSTKSSVLYANCPNTTACSLKIVVTTKSAPSGSQTTELTATARVADSNPTFADFAMTDTNTTVASNLTGDNTKIVQSLSNLKITITGGAAKNSATINSYTASLNGVTKTIKSTSATATIDFGVCEKSGTVSVTIIDSRGNRYSASKSLTLVAYSPPTFSLFSLTRLNNIEPSANLQMNGTVAVQAAKKGLISATCKYKKTSASSYTTGPNLTVTVNAEKGTWSLPATTILANKLEVDTSYEIVISVTDSFSPISKTTPIPSAGVELSIRKGKVGIGRVPSKNGTAEVWGKMYLNGGLVCPTGMSFEWNSNTIPEGYFLEDGRAVSRTTYADLFAAIGTKFGEGDGSTTFNIPDSRARVTINYKTSHGAFGTIGYKSGRWHHDHAHSHDAGTLQAEIGVYDNNYHKIQYRHVGAINTDASQRFTFNVTATNEDVTGKNINAATKVVGETATDSTQDSAPDGGGGVNVEYIVKMKIIKY